MGWVSSGKPRRKQQGNGTNAEDQPGCEAGRGDWSGWDFTNSPKLTVMLVDLEPQDRMRGRQGCG